MQTLRAGCSEAEPKKFLLRRRTLPRGAVRPKFNHLEMVTTFTDKLSLVRIDVEISSYRGNRTTPPARPSTTDSTDYNTLRR